MSAFYLFFCALCIGALEGVTEWLPISSTGHMLLLDRFIGMRNGVSEAFYSFFLVAVQLGAVLAVVVLYFDRLNPFGRKSAEEKKSTVKLWGLVLLGVFPAAVIGIPLDDVIEERFYGTAVIAVALILYGIAFVLLEAQKKGKGFRVMRADSLTWRDALLIGCFQVLSLIPGTSRSGSTILGGMLLGVSRPVAAEFSFFMAIPVMLGASLVRGGRLIASGVPITGSEWRLLLIGAITAFLVSLLVIRVLVSFVRRHSFSVFGYYRIVLGVVVLLTVSM